MSYRIICGDALAVLKTLPEESVQCCVTSPPYWGLRDYGTASWEGGRAGCDHGAAHWDGPKQTQGAQSGHAAGADKLARNECLCGARRIDSQLGLEPTIELYVAHIVEVFREVRRVLKDDGTLWLNLGDSYSGSGPSGASYQSKSTLARVGKAREGNFAISKTLGERGLSYAEKKPIPAPGLKPKDLCMIPARVALALQADGWWLRSEIVWHKPNPMPESVTDRPTKSHEMLYLLSKSERYFYDADAIKEPTTGSAHDRARKDRAADGQKTLPTAERNGMRPRTAFELEFGRPGEPDPHGPVARLRAPGVNPKAQKWPNAWSAEDGRHDGIGNGRFRPSGNKERKLAGPANGRLETHMGSGVPWPPQIRPKQNESFSAAVVRTVERRNRRTVWTIATKPFSGAHFATFPPKLIEPCILAGSRPGDVVLDPFGGAFTTGMVAQEHGRDFVLIELNPEYVKMGEARLADARAGSAPVLRRRSEPGGVEQADAETAKKPRSLSTLSPKNRDPLGK